MARALRLFCKTVGEDLQPLRERWTSLSSDARFSYPFGGALAGSLYEMLRIGSPGL
jgi:hypothetical protein